MVVRGFKGEEQTCAILTEGGFILYIRSTIGDKPAPSELPVLAEVVRGDDELETSEAMLAGAGKAGDDAPSLSESWTITNS